MGDEDQMEVAYIAAIETNPEIMMGDGHRYYMGLAERAYDAQTKGRLLSICHRILERREAIGHG